jgi:hypothetical protein
MVASDEPVTSQSSATVTTGRVWTAAMITLWRSVSCKAGISLAHSFTPISISVNHQTIMYRAICAYVRGYDRL